MKNDKAVTDEKSHQPVKCYRLHRLIRFISDTFFDYKNTCDKKIVSLNINLNQPQRKITFDLIDNYGS